ncbi:MAG TPA: SseB family protein [Frankiaceae bacterium]|nr:SseB family protein [Frankiaceae bacterium]
MTEDVGAADPAVLAALASGDPSQILEALNDARLLVAVLALPGAEHASEGEMALALLESGDGAQALPAFTGLDALRAWNPDARPVPRPAREVIGYAHAESLAAVVIDPGASHSQILWCERPEAPIDAPAADVQPVVTPQKQRWWRRR